MEIRQTVAWINAMSAASLADQAAMIAAEFETLTGGEFERQVRHLAHHEADPEARRLLYKHYLLISTEN